MVRSKFRVKRRRPAFLKRFRKVQRKRKMADSFGRPTKRFRGKSYRRSRFSRAVGGVGSISSILPVKKKVVHTYAVSVATSNHLLTAFMARFTNAAQNIGFRVNSLYDPSVTALGNFDKSAALYPYMAQFYQKYEVLWSKIQIVFRQREADNGGDVYAGLGIYRNSDNTLDGPGTTYDMARQTPAYRTKVLNCGEPDGKKQTTIEHFWSKKMVSKAELNNNISSIGNNPTYTEFFLPAVCGLAGMTEGPNWILTVRMTFMAEWSDRIDIDANTDIIPLDP